MTKWTDSVSQHISSPCWVERKTLLDLLEPGCSGGSPPWRGHSTTGTIWPSSAASLVPSLWRMLWAQWTSCRRHYKHKKMVSSNLPFGLIKPPFKTNGNNLLHRRRQKTQQHLHPLWFDGSPAPASALRRSSLCCRRCRGPPRREARPPDWWAGCRRSGSSACRSRAARRGPPLWARASAAGCPWGDPGGCPCWLSSRGPGRW